VTDRSVRPRRGFLRAEWVAAGLLLALVAAELALGVWARHFRTPYEDYDRARGTPTLVPGRYATPLGEVEIDPLGFVARVPRAASIEEDATGRASTALEASAFAIVSLGDSCTFGAGDAESTYPAALERRLERRPLGSQSGAARPLIVVNAGIAGLRSDEAVGRLDYALSTIHPEVVTLYLGWNDLMKQNPRAQTDTGPFSDIAYRLDGLWLVRGLRKLLFLELRARFGTLRTGADGETGRFADFRPGRFEANLHRLVAQAREAGARPLLVTLPHSLRRDLGPMELLEPKRQSPYFWGGNALGDFVDLIERYNETIRRVGAADGVPVAEVAERFDRMTRKADYFFDTMHPNRRGNALIAEVLERSLLEHGLLEKASGASKTRRED